jgi:hypothetical protein
VSSGRHNERAGRTARSCVDMSRTVRSWPARARERTRRVRTDWSRLFAGARSVTSWPDAPGRLQGAPTQVVTHPMPRAARVRWRSRGFARQALRARHRPAPPGSVRQARPLAKAEAAPTPAQAQGPAPAGAAPKAGRVPPAGGTAKDRGSPADPQCDGCPGRRTAPEARARRSDRRSRRRRRPRPQHRAWGPPSRDGGASRSSRPASGS